MAFENGCGAVGGVCSVMSGVTRKDGRGAAGVLIKGGGGQPRHRGGDRVVVWESRKGREDDALLHRLSEGDIG